MNESIGAEGDLGDRLMGKAKAVGEEILGDDYLDEEGRAEDAEGSAEREAAEHEAQAMGAASELRPDEEREEAADEARG